MFLKLGSGLVQKFINVIMMFFYVGSILYTMDYLSLISNVTSTHNMNQDLVLWLTIEITVFFAQIYSAMIYLLWMQIRHVCGRNTDKTFTRWSQDMLDFYTHEIQWFTSIVMMMLIQFEQIASLLFKMYAANKMLWGIMVLPSMLFISRCYQLCMFVPLRDE